VRSAWVLLSAGVDFPDYKSQVELAVKHGGASGVLGGRAFLEGIFPAAHCRGPTEVRRRRVRRASQDDRSDREVAGQAWFVRYGLTPELLQTARAAEGWHFRYGGGTQPAAAGGASGVLAAECIWWSLQRFFSRPLPILPGRPVLSDRSR